MADAAPDTLQQRVAGVLGDNYDVQEELRGGGMSRVFVAFDRHLGRRVVVKVLAAERAGTLSVERFRQEVLMAASLQHPHIVPILAAGDLGGVPYLLMPYVDGKSLRDRLDRGERLPLRDTVRILLDVARACAYAHERGIVHRDIKPDNVLMSGDAAMITDFGVARAIAAGERRHADARLTQDGFSVGSPRYMAPEQAAGDPDIDHRADIYAFGVLAFELIAGQPPFTGTTSAELLRAHLIQPPPDLHALRGDAPAALTDLVTWCLAKRPEDRPQSAAAIVAALETPGVISSSSRSAIRNIRRPSRTNTAAALAAVLAVLGGGWWFASRAAAERPADSLAVLPVLDRTGDSASAWMAAGLTDEVTAALGRIPGLRVASRRTVDRFRQDTAGPESIARTLGVGAVLDATLRRERSGDYQLTAQLIDGRNGLVLWSASIRGSGDDVLALQDSVVAGVLAALDHRPDSSSEQLRANDSPERKEAWQSYLLGKHALRVRRPELLREAITHFATALAADPMLPQAYAGMADAWGLLLLYDPSAGHEALDRALDAVERALALDPDLPEARASRGHLLAALWRWQEAEVDLRQAIAANPQLADAHQWLGEVLMVTGRNAEAVQALAAARAIDPLSPVIVGLHGWAFAAVGRSAEASEAAATAIRLDSASAAPRMMAGVAELLAGRPTVAIAHLERGVALQPGYPLMMGVLGQAYGTAGRRADAERILVQLDALPDDVPVEGARAHVHLGLGNTSAALDALDAAVVAREPMFAGEPLRSSLFATVSGSPRFAAILQTLGVASARRAE